jgi:hypothetical protein
VKIIIFQKCLSHQRGLILINLRLEGLHEKHAVIIFIGMGETRNVYRILVGKPEGKRPLGRPRLK